MKYTLNAMQATQNNNDDEDNEEEEEEENIPRVLSTFHRCVYIALDWVNDRMCQWRIRDIWYKISVLANREANMKLHNTHFDVIWPLLLRHSSSEIKVTFCSTQISYSSIMHSRTLAGFTVLRIHLNHPPGKCDSGLMQNGNFFPSFFFCDVKRKIKRQRFWKWLRTFMTVYFWNFHISKKEAKRE